MPNTGLELGTLKSIMGNRAGWFVPHSMPDLPSQRDVYLLSFKSRCGVHGNVGVMLGTVIEKLDVQGLKQEQGKNPK